MDPSDLYSLPLEQFTGQRNELAKALRREGRRDEAATVSKLRKPSAAAWAVNQLVRTQRREVGSLFEAGDALQKAQSDLLAGQTQPGALRDAVDAERTAVDELTEKARGLLSSDGHELTQATLERVSETLHAAALDADARAAVSDGRLERELRHVGLGALEAGPAPRRRPRARKAGAGSRERDQKADQVKAARRAEAEARDQWERATATLREAEKRRERAAGELREAEQAVREARRREVQAAREHQRAKRGLDRL
jgi:hypothetical protein